MSMMWSLLVVLVVLVALVVVRRAGPGLFAGTRPLRGALWCPSRARDVDVDLRIAAWDGRPVDVERCSVFGPDAAVGCEKSCLELDRPATSGRSRRRFWCAAQAREVEVEFEERGVLWFRWPATVVSCTAFDPPAAVDCRRLCIDSMFRRQWPPALPVHAHGVEANAVRS